MATSPLSNQRSQARPIALRTPLSSFGVSLKEFIRHPSMVGSAFPASRWLVNGMLEPLDWSRIRIFVEYGPGTGHFTKKVLERLLPDARMLALDTGTDFVRLLDATISDERLSAVQASAENIAEVLEQHGLDSVDCILSGLPFSTLDPSEATRIMDASCSVLSPDGQFIAYQMRSAIASLLKERFQDIVIGREWRNLPPCHLYWANRLRK